MITIHHLAASQSDRIVWLMEELGLPYRLRWYARGPDRLLPPEYLALHTAATAPVIDDGELRLAESAAIVEYICQRHAAGRLTVPPASPDYPHYLYWMHFNNNVLGLHFARMALRAGASGPQADRIARLVDRRENGYYAFLNARLGEAPYLAGAAFTCADLMSVFQLTTVPRIGGRGIDDLPNVQAYVRRIEARPAYARAMAIAGPDAPPPAA